MYYYSTAYRRPEDAEIYEQFVEQDQASTVVKSRKEDRRWAKCVQLQLQVPSPILNMSPLSETMVDIDEYTGSTLDLLILASMILMVQYFQGFLDCVVIVVTASS